MWGGGAVRGWGKGHVTHIMGGSSTNYTIANVAGAAGAVLFTLTVNAGSIPAAAAIVLHTEPNSSPKLFKHYGTKSVSVINLLPPQE